LSEDISAKDSSFLAIGIESDILGRREPFQNRL